MFICSIESEVAKSTSCAVAILRRQRLIDIELTYCTTEQRWHRSYRRNHTQALSRMMCQAFTACSVLIELAAAPVLYGRSRLGRRRPRMASPKNFGRGAPAPHTTPTRQSSQHNDYPTCSQTMAKTKSKSHRSKASDSVLHSTSAHIKTPTSKPIAARLSEAADLLSQSQPEAALTIATECLRRLQSEQPPPSPLPSDSYIDSLLQIAAQEKPVLPQAVVLVAEIHLALGDAAAATSHFEAAVRVDPDGALVSADPYLYLAQLCEEGGAKSIAFFEKGCEVLRNEIEVLGESLQGGADEEGTLIVKMKQAKLAEGLCGMAEVFMTDLSFEDDAEAKCEGYITEAVAVCPDDLAAGTLQVLASVRISQQRVEEAREALRRSLAVWQDIPPEVESESRPDFATRVSASRLLMEVDLLPEAMGVIEGLIRDDDESVESWYLGGWCQVLSSQKENSDQTQAQEKAKAWLDNCLRLYQVQAYEDDRLRDHALELKQGLMKALGIEHDDDDWEDEDDEDLDGDVEVSDNDDGDVDMT